MSFGVQLVAVKMPSGRPERGSRGSSGVHSLATMVPDVEFSFSDDHEMECTVETTPWISGEILVIQLHFSKLMLY